MTRAELLAPPDDLQVEAGARGELMVARIRLWIVLLLTPIPIINAIELPHRENWIGGTLIAVALIAALAVHRAVSRDPRRSWLGLVSTTLDITLICSNSSNRLAGNCCVSLLYTLRLASISPPCAARRARSSRACAPSVPRLS